eukprot:COSAG05_NODE_1184_length_5590_cov_57.730468_3_plen_76_part_00
MATSRAVLARAGKLEPEEQVTVLSVHLLAQLLDGDLNEDEFALWGQIKNLIDVPPAHSPPLLLVLELVGLFTSSV